ncbi:MAG: DUF452 family protein [Cognatishimia sp.]|uniref:pimeloyl-ACP methyl esterase BioG family protein n=1 Tax=Cognatishimia sp. TaxID=2211648 RepID=UPI003B8AFA0E
MQAKWLKQSGSDEVIIVFGGWAIGPSSLAHLSGSQDVLYVDDYRLLSALPQLSDYKLKTLVAYSFGVAAAAHWLTKYPDVFDRKVAINGSPTPVDRRLGIPPVIFKRTKEGLSQDSFQSFLILCFGAEQPHTDINVEARQAELQAVEDRGAAKTPQFDGTWISTEDRIFPSANLERAFADQADRTTSIAAPHVPFAHWSSWDEVIQ